MTRSLVILLLLCLSVQAQPMPKQMATRSIVFKPLNLTLQWLPSASPDVVGYDVFHGPSSGSYTQSVDAGIATTITFNNLVKTSSHFFAATARNSSGISSDYSNEVKWPRPIVVTVNGLALESVERIGDLWNPLWTDVYSVTNPVGNQFFQGLTTTSITIKSLH